MITKLALEDTQANRDVGDVRRRCLLRESGRDVVVCEESDSMNEAEERQQGAPVAAYHKYQAAAG